MPSPYLSKIVHRLARAGLVHTQRGIHGGVTLVEQPKDITLFRVCSALEDPVIEARCMLGTTVCSDDRGCPAHAFSTAERQRMLEFLQSTTIADIAEFEMRRRWKAEANGANGTGATNGSNGSNGTNGSVHHGTG